MPVHLSKTSIEAIDRLLESYPKDGHPGTQVGIVNKQGEVIYLNSTGVKRSGSNEPIERDTVFGVFSMSKVITGLGILQLSERGLLDLDQPLDYLVPELAAGKKDLVVEDRVGGGIKIVKANKPITTRQLLTHTAGFGYSWYNPTLKAWFDQHGKSADWKDIPLVNEPGTKWEYGLNLDWAGLVLERVTGITLAQYAQENIFQPLGLKDITYDINSRPDLQSRLATLHQWDSAANTFTPRTNPTDLIEIPLGGGGAGAFSTVEDYLQVMVVLLNGGRGANGATILKPESYTSVFTDQVANVPDRGALEIHGSTITSDKSLAHTGLGLLPGTKKGWGLTALLNFEDVPDDRKTGSAEWGGIANLSWIADPKSEIAVVIFNQILPYGVPAFFDLYHAVQKEVYRSGALVSSQE